MVNVFHYKTCDDLTLLTFIKISAFTEPTDSMLHANGAHIAWSFAYLARLPNLQPLAAIVDFSSERPRMILLDIIT